MTRTRNAINGLLALLLAACFALSGLVISLAADAAQDQLLYVVQLIVGTADPTTVSGSYGLVPDEAANPMPTDKDGETVNVFDLTGNSTKTASFHFTEPGVYQYTAGKLKDSTKTTFTAEDFEEGTKDYPLTHVFGFKVNRRADGSLEVIPYTCEDNQATFFTDGRGMTIWNYVKADAPAEPTTKKDEPTTKEEEPTTKEEEPTTAEEEPTTAKEEPTTAKEEPTSVKPVTNKNNEPVTNSNGSVKTTIVYVNGRATTTTTRNNGSRANGVNTGDESHLILWVVILAVAALGLILLVLARRNRDDDEENS